MSRPDREKQPVPNQDNQQSTKVIPRDALIPVARRLIDSLKKKQESD